MILFPLAFDVAYINSFHFSLLNDHNIIKISINTSSIAIKDTPLITNEHQVVLSNSLLGRAGSACSSSLPATCLFLLLLKSKSLLNMKIGDKDVKGASSPA